MTNAAGVARFVRYAAPPNRLGYCGPDGFGDGGVVDAERVAELRRTAAEFVGAYPYLELLAGAAGVQDPLADIAVEAYWIGNPIVRNVATGTFGRSLAERFRFRAGPSWDSLRRAVPSALCTHAFHVFVVSPWVGLMRDGVVDEPLAIVDDCRVSWGTVVTPALEEPTAVVDRTPLRWRKGRLVAGHPEAVRVSCGLPVDRGAVVAIHWGNVCDVLTPLQAAWLRYVTNTQLALAASIGRPC